MYLSKYGDVGTNVTCMGWVHDFTPLTEGALC